jgi:hypothetical protein
VNSLNDVPVLTTHYIDGKFDESHGREVLDLVRPTDRKVIGRVCPNDPAAHVPGPGRVRHPSCNTASPGSSSRSSPG